MHCIDETSNRRRQAQQANEQTSKSTRNKLTNKTSNQRSSATVKKQNDQTKDLKQIRSTLKKIDEENAKLKKDRDALNSRLGKHDIGNLAENKPGLVEKIINKASDSAARCVEIASGSPLTEEELNGTPNRECPSFWPDSNTTE